MLRIFYRLAAGSRVVVQIYDHSGSAVEYSRVGFRTMEYFKKWLKIKRSLVHNDTLEKYTVSVSKFEATNL